jgi:phosphoribosylpyrophosphate synthetase
MELNRYPDGTSYINNTKLGQQVFRLNNYEDLWKLNQFVDAFHSQHDTLTAKMRPNIIISNLPDAQADRRFNKGESFGLKLILKFLAGLEANFSFFHPHNSEVVEIGMELLNNPVTIIDNSNFINKVLVELAYNHNSPADIDLLSEDLILLSADAGGFKPLMKLADKLQWKGETESASKSRKYEEGESKLIQKIDRQDFKGKDILIIDDICVYGGTFKGLAKMLRERNCGNIYLAVSHLTIQNHKGGDDVFKYFDKVFTTNSKFYEYYIESYSGEPVKPSNLEVINLF